MSVNYKYRQISLKDTFLDCQDMFVDDAPSFFQLLHEHFDIQEFISSVFRNAFYQHLGRKRDYPLEGFLSSLILQKIFSIPSDSLLLLFLRLSRELREFCGFSKVPDAPLLTRFKQNFEPYIELMFEQMVDYTEPICQLIDSELAQILTFDTSGIGLYVNENNPKTLNALIRKLKSFYKDKPDVDPYSMAYGLMPSHAASCPDAKQMYINGHFCYAFKFGILTNGLGIVRDISFYNKAFLDAHPDIVVERKSDSPDEDKSLADSKALIPVLKDFFRKHPLINPKTFLGDAAFDSIEIYKYLLQDTSIGKAYIPLNGRISLPDADCPLNENGIPCCPKDPSLPMKREGSKSHLRCGLPTMKFVCPKMKWEYNKETRKSRRVCHCEDPCTDSSCGRMFYIYPEKNLRLYPGTLRDTDEWHSTYKIRVNVEKSINHFKDSFCVAGRKTQNEKTLHADLLLAGITQLITVMVADRIHKHQYIRSLKPLIA